MKKNEKRKRKEEEAAAEAAKDKDENDDEKPKKRGNQPKFYEVREGVEFKNGRTYMKKRNKWVGKI